MLANWESLTVNNDLAIVINLNNELKLYQEDYKTAS